jgi:hypothetical protein
MKVSEWKLENSVVVTDENFELLDGAELFGGVELIKGSKFMEAIVDDINSPNNGGTIYFMDTQMDSFNIVEDPEWDDDLPVADQKFKVSIK